MREYLIEYFGAELITGMETDDACGIEQWANKDRSTCIVTMDKDLDMIPGWHYNYVKQEMYYVDLATANKKFWLQVLTGDQTDNIQGIPKVGPKTAEKILHGVDGWTDMYNTVAREYKNRGLTIKHFHENATLLWMQREYMINYDGGKIEFGTESYEEDNEESVASEGADENTTLA